MVAETKFQTTEIGPIPRDWECVEFKNLFQFKQGVQTPIEDQIRVERSGYKQFIRIVDLTSASEPPRYIPDPGSAHHIHPKDLFMVRYGSPGLIGYLKEGVIANNLFRLLPKREIDSSFYFQYLSSRQQDILEISGSSTMPAISFSTLGSLKIVYVPPKEQRAIASVLTDIDSSIEGLEKLIAKKRDIKQATMQQLLTGKTRLPGFSEKWVATKFSDVLNLQNGFSFKSEDFQNGGIPLIRISDIQGGRVTSTNSVYLPEIIGLPDSFLIKQGDLLIAMSGATTGKVGIYQESHAAYQNQRVGKFVTSKALSYLFLAALLESSLFQNRLHSMLEQGAQPNISARQIEGLVFAMPTECDEQEAIGSLVSDMNFEIGKLEQKLEKLKLLKQGMMQELLTGRIRLI